MAKERLMDEKGNIRNRRVLFLISSEELELLRSFASSNGKSMRQTVYEFVMNSLRIKAKRDGK